MEEYLFGLLSGAVAFPIAWGRLGDGTTTPRARITRVGGDQDHDMSGPGLLTTTVQIDVFGASFAQATAAAREIRAALAGHRGGPILGAFFRGARDGFDDDSAILDRVSLTFSISHRG